MLVVLSCTAWAVIGAWNLRFNLLKLVDLSAEFSYNLLEVSISFSSTEPTCYPALISLGRFWLPVMSSADQNACRISRFSGLCRTPHPAEIPGRRPHTLCTITAGPGSNRHSASGRKNDCSQLIKDSRLGSNMEPVCDCRDFDLILISPLTGISHKASQRPPKNLAHSAVLVVEQSYCGSSKSL